jgi:hypothetical protein
VFFLLCRWVYESSDGCCGTLQDAEFVVAAVGFSAGSVARSVLFKLMCCCSSRLLLASLVAHSAFLVSAVATRPRFHGAGRGREGVGRAGGVCCSCCMLLPKTEKQIK